MPRLIVVTGAGSGIGKATAERFAANGDKVLLVGRRKFRLDEALHDLRERVPGADVDCVAADLSGASGAERLGEHVAGLALPVAGLICCAGAAPSSDGDGLTSLDTVWRAALSANVMTAVLTVASLESALADGGSIVLFSSIAAYRGTGGNGAYGAAKAALHSYTHTLATRLGERDVNVNAIAPGYVAETEFFGGGLSDARQALLIRQTLLNRPGAPRDVAELAFFLSSPEGAYITSQIVQINGGSLHGV